MVGAATFDGTKFEIVANDTIAGTSASWMLFKEPNLLYAVDENSNTTRLFNVSLLSFSSPPSKFKQLTVPTPQLSSTQTPMI